MNPFPITLNNRTGLRMQMNACGSVRRIECDDVLVNLFPVSGVEDGMANLYLRVHGRDGISSRGMLGPSSPLGWQADERGMSGAGEWGALRIQVRLQVAQDAPAWFWHVRVENTGGEICNVDLIQVQDVGLAHYGAVRLNEFYVSQYIDHVPLEHAARGWCVASRQNQSMGGRYPSLVMGSLGRAVAYATDALSLYGRGHRNDGVMPALREGLPGKRLQHEHAAVALQEEIVGLAPGAVMQGGFFGIVQKDHPQALGQEDLARVDEVLALPEALCGGWTDVAVAGVECLFGAPRFLDVEDADETALARWVDGARVHEERDDGRLLSFFTTDHAHAVLREKERMVLRPHGLILRTGSTLVPDEAAMTSTAWMSGVFHSMVTQGHVSINRFLSTCHTYLGVLRSHGQRVFVEVWGGWRLLGVPSLFVMSQQSCRWVYAFDGGEIEVLSTASVDRHELGLSVRVLAGPARRFLITHHVALAGDDGLPCGAVIYQRDGNRLVVRAPADSDVGRRFPQGNFVIEGDEASAWEQVGGDEMLWADGVARGEPFLCVKSAPVARLELTLRGGLLEAAEDAATPLAEAGASDWQLRLPAGHARAGAVAAMTSVLPWLVNNAYVHYLAPRGLEQYSGGGWGTRDVCQGPLELLLALGHFSAARDLLCRVFRQQNEDGDWPQWFMFFERERNIRPGDSHGDIVYWPVLALAEYLVASRDASILDEQVPYFHADGNGEQTNLAEHVSRALDLMRRRVIPGTVLAAYGHGDWNDSLQPAQSDMRDHLCSSWTVILNYQTLLALADAFERLGRAADAEELRRESAVIREEFQHRLILDGVVAGLLYFHPQGEPEALLHPGDETTGLSYSLLPMIHAIINDMFTPEQAAEHLRIIHEHLSGPDGARLFDKPMRYEGGISKNFQRAETASYFGREIGIMYTHAHLRYAEALARYGNARGLWEALRRINPIGLHELDPVMARRQLNCYYSSSDAAFADRYEAYQQYDRVKRGEVALEGGWRVYSSGSGIAVRLLLQGFLGIRLEADGVIIDPVIDPALDGLTAVVSVGGHRWLVRYQIGEHGCGPVSVRANGTELPGTRQPNPYRLGGLRIARSAWQVVVRGQDDELLVVLG